MQEIAFTRHAASIVADVVDSAAVATVTRYKISPQEEDRECAVRDGDSPRHRQLRRFCNSNPPAARPFLPSFPSSTPARLGSLELTSRFAPIDLSCARSIGLSARLSMLGCLDTHRRSPLRGRVRVSKCAPLRRQRQHNMQRHGDRDTRYESAKDRNESKKGHLFFNSRRVVNERIALSSHMGQKVTRKQRRWENMPPLPSCKDGGDIARGRDSADPSFHCLAFIPFFPPSVVAIHAI